MPDIYRAKSKEVCSRAFELIKSAKKQNMKTVLIMAPIFTEKNIGEGYIQRVKAIDDEILCDTYNIYVDFESENPMPSITVIDRRHALITMPAHSKTCAKRIEKIALKCKTVYTHSVMRAMADITGKDIHRLYKHKNIFYIWDVHGAVPEEFALADNYFEAQNAGEAEELFINTANVIVVVNNAMKNHLQKKYSKQLDNTVLLPIFSTVSGRFDRKKKSTDYPTAVYAGGMQAWQNISLMQKTLKNCAELKKINMFVSDPKEFIRLWAGSPVPPQLIVTTKTPGEVMQEYIGCHYGFVMRDDITVNNVACPTKLIEYIRFGIVPIVKSEKIGDFADMGMRYLRGEDMINNIPSFDEYLSMAQENLKILKKMQDIHKSGAETLRSKIYE